MANSEKSAVLRDLYQDWTKRMAADSNPSISNLRSMFDEWGRPALEPENVSYKSDTVGGVPALWVIPDGSDAAQVIVFTHGGGFAVGSADSHRKMAAHLAKALGTTALVLDYRRAPEYPFPAQLEDAVAVHKALHAKGYEARNIVTAGDSAGGNLAISSVLFLRDLGLPLPGAVIAYSPWLDMALRGPSLETNAATDALVGKPILEAMVGMYLGGKIDPLNPLANPLENHFTGFPPLYINAGGDETLLSDSQSLYAKARSQGVDVTLSVVPGMQHVFPALSGRAVEANDELKRIAAWYRGVRETRSASRAKTEGADVDAVVVGAGFGGLYAVHKLRDEQGLKIQAYDNASDVGGTWFWNRYPGALSDTESFCYRYSFDKELLQNGKWKNRYLTQPEILDYLTEFADRYDLRRSYQFNTKVTSARFNESTALWYVTTDKGDLITAKYLVTGLGLLSATNIPPFKGVQSFGGKIYHTGAWPQGVDLTGKRVGVIGTGSTGVQVITAVAPIVEHLTVFQRSAQYVVPIGNWPEDEDKINKYKASYDAIWKQIRASVVAFGFEESKVPAVSVSAEERERVFEQAWNRGGGFRFMFETFSDIATSQEANDAAANFIKRKIAQIVKDPERARRLTPNDLYAKRPLCAIDYYDVYNRSNVTLADIKSDPIAEFTPRGIRLESGAEHELDVVIFATGYDAVDGNYTRIDMRGRSGVSLKEKWKDGPLGYLGMMESGFPNFFMILGPNGPFTNLVPSIETQVEWISDTIGTVELRGVRTVEPTQQAQDEWVETCRNIANATLFPKAQSWIFGANIPGKKNAVMFYLGGLGAYRGVIEGVRNGGYSTMQMSAGAPAPAMSVSAMAPSAAAAQVARTQEGSQGGRAMGRVNGKVALVTGGAMGMGQSHSELLASEGAHVFVCDLDILKGRQVVDEIVSRGGKADFIKLDVTSESDWRSAIAAIRTKTGRLDVLVNNAGILILKPAHETATEEWDRVFNVNVRGAYFGIRESVPLMKDSGGGSIINVSSIYGLVGAPMAGAYIASKGAVRLMTKSCAADLTQFGIRVNSIHPGVIDTPMTKDLLHADEATRKAILGSTLLNRPSQPVEVSQAVLFLASNESSFFQGSEVVVDGGYTAN